MTYVGMQKAEAERITLRSGEDPGTSGGRKYPGPHQRGPHRFYSSRLKLLHSPGPPLADTVWNPHFPVEENVSGGSLLAPGLTLLSSGLVSSSNSPNSHDQTPGLPVGQTSRILPLTPVGPHLLGK